MKTFSAILGVGLAAVVAVAMPQSALAQVVGKAEDGLKKASQCIGCHEIPGYRASFPSVYRVPMIAGQSAKYIEASLQAYKKGDRNHPTMRGIAGSLSDQDMADLAALYGSK
jgi:cytochrome c553